MRFLNGLMGLWLAVFLAACGGGGNSNPTPTPVPTPDPGTTPTPQPSATPTPTPTPQPSVTPAPTPTPQPSPTPAPELPSVGRLIMEDKLVSPARNLPLINIPFTTAPNNMAQRSGRTNDTGEYEYNGAESVTFTILNESFGPIPAKTIVTPEELATSYCDGTAQTALASCQYNVAQNLQRTLRNLDADYSLDNGITVSEILGEFPADLKSAVDIYEVALSKKLALQGRQLAPLFKPSLGINLEEPQPEADDVGGQPIPFADLFRIGRPFPEFSCSQIVYDEYGWPVTIPPECATEEQANLGNVNSYATTLIARFAPLGTIPAGKYTVLYEGTGNIQYSGIGLKVPAESTQGRDIIEITTARMTTPHLNSAGLRVQINNMTDGDPVRNMRIIMPGGTCAGNPFLHVYSADECPAGAYQSFVSRYEADSNAIVFNPQFMNFLKDFKVIRTMNFMKASPRNPCFTFTDDEYRECILQEFNWDQRAKMNDAMWGGSFRTDLAKRAGRGVPLEVTVELANQLKRDPWFNLPHNATDDYVEKYATYVRDNLNSDLKAHIEYTNEPWNGPFWANPYTIMQGQERGLDANGTLSDYWTGLYYYTERSVEIFNIWQNVWGGTDRLVRIINTQHNGGEFASRNMLNHKGAFQSIDALASAPYFFGCWNRASTRCQNEEAIPKVLTDITSVDDIFEILDNPNNPYGMESTKRYVTLQAEVAEDFNVDLYAYEGGQHLTVTWGDDTLTTAKKHSILDLFRAANRDPRMADRYSHLLHGWKEEGGKLFALYTMPQTYHTFGTFGIKEHLAQPRSAAPKYDMSMQFQEDMGRCWWEGCE